MSTPVVHNPNHLPVARVKELQPTQGNLKDLTKENYEKLKQSIEKHGFIFPMAVWVDDKGVHHLLDGHQRQRLLNKEWPDLEVPMLFINAGSMQEAAEILLKISSQYGRITQEGLDEFMATYELAETEVFEGVHFDALPLLGTQQDDIDVEEDEAPELDEDNIISKPGEVYQLGRHRLMCGSATVLEDVSALTNGADMDLLLTDPPYNVDYEGKTKKKMKIKNDKKADEDFRNFLTDAFVNATMVMKDGASFYIFHADSQGYNFRAAVRDAQLEIRQCLAWVKQTMVMGRQDYQWQHEPILYGWKEGAGHSWYSDRKQTTVLEFDRPTQSKEHPTMKPVKLCAYLMMNNTKEGDLVLDPFGGSGSILIAAEQLNRTCYTMELDPKYCDVIRKRYHILVTGEEDGWEKATSVSATE